ncbi:MAG TPA: argininosuccinate lyase [Aquifex sp.]|uniref:Argininosuccinate lyase n=1 Tax=Aquifex aeolicus TaxID=63363 RepID=A0A9D0YNN1_AQUAO|nr:argininosuccinate lyase [Aquifex sp.]HIP97887.1 argininosuccinate lyase [Aquifex aeolicus]
MSENKPWGGRFSEQTDKFVEEFTESVSFDKELAEVDIKQSIAHTKTLLKAKVLTEDEAQKIIDGLYSILEDIKKGNFEWKREVEDVHMNVERELTNRIGRVGGKLHTARSRNDQVATDFRLYLKGQIKEIIGLLKALRKALTQKAEETPDIIVSGYTHLQKAQPIRLAHWFLAYREMFIRDTQRFLDTYRRLDASPLGSGALAGVDFPLDRFYTARNLGFSRVTRNSLSATADRDFALEFLNACNITMLHLSRLAEDLIIWASEEFGYVDLPDKLCTGSSIMPNKKNPDVLELIRGKTGRVLGDYVALSTVLKGLPMAYNRDLQEDKEPVFDAVRTLKGSLIGMRKIIEGLKPKRERMEENAGNLTLATDLANYLVQKGVPFREAHQIVGKLVSYVLQKGKRMEDLSLEELKEFSSLFGEDALLLLKPSVVADRRATYGGTAKKEIKRQIGNALKEDF